ncbi:polygalacturonase-like [Carica papaya]|uniref:polygalacturonase-like n=1 Tax=Carica papaya TaxID=3649 RepID=UPI000B8CDB63|nr:polygalacturonase-like [Carica papaya]
MAEWFPSCLYNFITLLVLVLCMNPPLLPSATTSLNVLSFGAKPDGKTDSTQAFMEVWDAACGASDSAMIYVPKGRYLLGSLQFKGENCKTNDITFRIDGTLMVPPDYRVLLQVENWLSFNQVTGVSIIGGKLDAKGSDLWACKAAGGNCSDLGATTLRFTNSNNIRIKGLMSLNSQMFHIVINKCQNVKVEGVKVIAAGNSPNTDGIHVQQSTDVGIFNSTIKTGDDCISIGPGTKNLWIQRVACGPGHGISIGSLGKDAEEEGVQNVTVKQTVFAGTTNGLRIKAWARPSTGFVQGIRFLSCRMQNVENPIIIDQNYCPHNKNCPNQVSGVKIRDITYQDIQGTSATPIAIKFDCSSSHPCTGIRVQNVKLTYFDEAAESSCTNIDGKSFGLVIPIVDCF